VVADDEAKPDGFVRLFGVDTRFNASISENTDRRSALISAGALSDLGDKKPLLNIPPKSKRKKCTIVCATYLFITGSQMKCSVSALSVLIVAYFNYRPQYDRSFLDVKYNDNNIQSLH